MTKRWDKQIVIGDDGNQRQGCTYSMKSNKGYTAKKSKAMKLKLRAEKSASKYKNREINAYRDATLQFMAANYSDKAFTGSKEWVRFKDALLYRRGKYCFDCRIHFDNVEMLVFVHKLSRRVYPELAFNRENIDVLCKECDSKRGSDKPEVSCKVILRKTS